MSHISTVQVMILEINLDEFEAACKALGLQLNRGQKQHRTYGGARTPCEHAVVDPNNPNAYELGLVRARYDEQTERVVQDREGNGYIIALDTWAGGRGMMSKVGDGCGTLLQDYALRAAKKQAAKSGWTTTEERLENGSIRLRCKAKPQFQQATAGRGW